MLNVWSRKTNFDDELDIKLGLFLVSEMETKIEKLDPFGDPQKIGQEWLTWRENSQMFLMSHDKGKFVRRSKVSKSSARRRHGSTMNVQNEERSR